MVFSVMLFYFSPALAHHSVAEFAISNVLSGIVLLVMTVLVHRVIRSLLPGKQV